MFDDMRRVREDLMDEVIDLSYFMRGALSYDSAYHMTYIERTRMKTFLHTRLEEESKKMYPNY